MIHISIKYKLFETQQMEIYIESFDRSGIINVLQWMDRDPKVISYKLFENSERITSLYQRFNVSESALVCKKFNKE